MADFTLGFNDVGAYEISIAAGATVVVAATGVSFNTLTVLVHSGTAPVYAKPGTSINQKDSTSTMIFPAGTWATIPASAANANFSTSIAITSASAAVVSVYRS